MIDPKSKDSMTETPKPQDTAPSLLDATGLLCPMPVIRMEALLRRAQPGDQIRILTDDPIATIDIPHFCAEGGHTAVRQPDLHGACVFLVTAGGKSGPKPPENS